MTLDAHRSDNDDPHVLVTEDYGKTWRYLRANLPRGSSRVIREDIKNENLLYLGTEFAAYVSLNRGKDWTKINNNLPTVAIHEFAQHQSSGEVVVATHGRSLWVLDVTCLRQMTAEALQADAHLYRPNTVVQWQRTKRRGTAGTRRFVGANPSTTGEIYYSLAKDARSVKLEIQDQAGKQIRELTASEKAGLHRVTWDLRGTPQRGATGGRDRSYRSYPGGSSGKPGTYQVVLEVDGKELSQPMVIEADPNFPAGTSARREMEREMEEEGIERGPSKDP